MESLGTFPPEKLKAVIEFLEKEHLAYTTAKEMISLGHTKVPSGLIILYAQSMDASQSMRYVKELGNHLMS